MNNVEEIEISIDDAKNKIARMDSLKRLSKDQDWISIIEDGLFLHEASNLVLLKAAPGFQGEEEQSRINNQITTIGGVRQYFSSIMQMGIQAQKSLVEHEEMRTEMLAEE